MPWSDPLLAAVHYKSYESVHSILQSGADPNGKNKDVITPLEIAAENDDTTSIRALILHKADVNIQNENGETPLHVAASGNTSFEGFELILKANADIYGKDHCDKTALHLACDEFMTSKIKAILNLPNPPVNFKDDEGATPIHLLVRSQSEHSDVIDIIKLALQKGFDINAQTLQGESIMHVGSQHIFSDELLPHLLNLKSIDTTLQDKFGDNFLHSYLKYRSGIDFSEEFLCNLMEGKFLSASPEVLEEIMNQQNDSGYIPLSCYLFQGVVNVNVVKKFVSFLRNANIKENLGHSLIHIATESPLSSDDKIRTIKYLISKGADLNATDIFGRTPLFYASNMRIVKILVDNGSRVNATDRCKRTPLMVLLKTCQPRIIQYLINKGSHINSKDKFGSNALHYAAWENRIREMEILIRCGINTDQRDKAGRTPLDIAKFWRCKEAVAILLECSPNCKSLARRKSKTRRRSKKSENPNDRTDVLWMHGKKSFLYSEYQSTENLRKHFDIPENVEDYIRHILNFPGVGIPHVDHEAIWVESLVLKVVKSMAEQIGKYDKRFKCSVFRSGSTFEDTKVDDPDEFDFLFQLDRFSDMCTINSMIENDIQCRGFAGLVPKKEIIDLAYQRYFDYDRSLICERLRHDFYILVRRVLTSKDTWLYDEVFIDTITIQNAVDKPIVNFQLLITGALYKSINVSIDIVPAIRIKKWWPINANTDVNNVVSRSILQEGCLLLCQEPSDLLTLERVEREGGKSTFFRVSCAPAEIKLITTLPEWIRKSYAIAKLMKGGFMCPKIKFRMQDATSEDFTRSQHFRVLSGDDEISSYMLKNSLFHVVAAEDSMLYNMPYQDKSSLYNSIALAMGIYDYLSKAAKEKSLSVFFLPYLNIFEEAGVQPLAEAHTDVPNDDRIPDNFKIIEIFCDFIHKLYHL